MQTVHDFIWLASQSPRRQALLAQIGVAPQLLLPGDDEDALQAETRDPFADDRRQAAAELDALRAQDLDGGGEIGHAACFRAASASA